MTYGGLGQPGTRITQQRGREAETWRYVTQATIGTVALQIVLTAILGGCLIVGSWSLPVLFCITGALASFVIIVVGRPLPRSFVAIVGGNLWSIGLAVGIIWRETWWTVLEQGMQAVIGLFVPLPGWVYLMVLGVSAVLMLKVKWQAVISMLIFGVCAALLYGFVQGWRYTRWLLIPYSWPLIGFALLLAFAMTEQMLRPTIEWTVKPLTIAEIQEAGGWMALFFPGLMAREPAPALPERTIRIERIERNGKGQKWDDDLPGDPKHINFYRAVAGGASFSVQTAIKNKCRADFENFIRPIFEAMEFAYPNDIDNPQAGWSLTGEGEQAIKDLAAPSPT